jgi:transposase-like protein
MQLLIEHGTEDISHAIQCLLNQAMKLEREQFLQATPYQRTASRRGWANGFKPKTLASRIGTLELDIPQTRNADFYPSCLEKGLRSDRALLSAMAEMYLQGVSTRHVTRVLEKMCGLQVSSSQVSRVTAALDQELTQWRNRPLAQMPYLYLDARYEKVRCNGLVRDCAVLIALGVDLNGKRHVLGLSVALSEAEVHWRSFLQSLLQRGLTGIQLIISDDHCGLCAARTCVLPSVPWQRCQFHLQQNAQAHIPKAQLKPQVASELKAIFNAPNLTEAQSKLNTMVNSYEKSAPKLAQWLEHNIPHGLTVFAFPPPHRQRLRTTNPIERLNQEIKRRTRTARLFTNEASLLRLVSAILAETHDHWQTSPIPYLNMNLLTPSNQTSTQENQT